MGGPKLRRNERRAARTGLVLAIATLLATAGFSAVGGAAVRTADPGVTAKTITLGYIYPATGVAASISQHGIKGFEARIARQNAQGGVNGRKIKYEVIDDQSSGANLTGAQDLVENRHVFAVVNQSPFAFLSWRWLLEHDVPMIGAGTDGTYYQQKGNENILSSGGNGIVFGDVIYDTSARAMKMAGATKAAALAYGQATSSVSSAKAFMNYAAPGVGLDPVYTNTSLDFGSSDVGPPVLGMKNAGANAVYLPMAAATNVAVVQGLQQSGVEMKASVLGTGYGQDFLDSPAARNIPSSALFAIGYKPVELETTATKKFQADLKKYADFTGVPDFGVYNGYIIADMIIKGLEKAGGTPTRQGLIDGVHGLGLYDQAGLACQPVDVGLAGRGKPPAKNCGYFLQVKDGKFVPFPKSGKPVVGKLVGSPEALAAAASGATATTTTTTAPAAP
jgi:ABC-type branched-subunit amino acid transport system substrate-binding protein